MSWSKKYLPSLLALLIILFIWHALIVLSIVPEYLLPRPSQVLQAGLDLFPDFLTASLSTFRSTLIGFLLSAILGFSCALVFVSSDFLKRALLPFAIFFQTVPVVAIAPLLVIWFGFGESTVRVSAFIVSFFPMLANSLVGLSSSDPGLQELFQVYRASPLKKLISLQIPASLSFVMAGLKISAGLSVIGAIVGEFVAGGGLGGMIDSARTQQRVDIVFAAVILSSLLGILFVASIRIISKALLKWRPFYSPDVI